MPRLAVTLRRFAQLILRHLDCASCASCRPLLAVPLHEEGRCLHLFDIRATLSTVEVKAALVALLGDAAPEFVEELRAEPDQEPPPPPPPCRTNWTRLVPPPVLSGHVASLSGIATGGAMSPCGSVVRVGDREGGGRTKKPWQKVGIVHTDSRHPNSTYLPGRTRHQSQNLRECSSRSLQRFDVRVAGVLCVPGGRTERRSSTAAASRAERGTGA